GSVRGCCVIDARELDHDAFPRKRIMIFPLCLSMIFSENRFPLVRIMLLSDQACAGVAAS
ncbi:hypothetical protein, partial [Bradyrhizobium sp.]|uniref:hypothetical protein n=1 Tax=Bradyrhizobium sp. TaxID=376 RepID=UPI002901F500